MKIQEFDGELKVELKAHNEDRISFKDIGAKSDYYDVKGGNLRILIDIGPVEFDEFYRMPIAEFTYRDNIQESEWIVEFNGQNILERIDHSGHSTIILFSRNRLKELIQRHENKLIIHGDFSKEVHIDLAKSSFHVFGK